MQSYKELRVKVLQNSLRKTQKLLMVDIDVMDEAILHLTLMLCFIELRDVPGAWETRDSGMVSLDFKMPGKGMFYKTNNKVYVRFGITEALPFGGPSDYAGKVSSIGAIEDISCGVTACFALAAGKVYFREGLLNVCLFLLFLKLFFLFTFQQLVAKGEVIAHFKFITE